MTKVRLQQLVDEHGSIDRAACAAGVSRKEFREQCHREGVRAKSRATEHAQESVEERFNDLIAYLGRVDAYVEQMAELLDNTGWSGYPFLSAMLDHCEELGLDQKTSYAVAIRACEIGDEVFWSLYKRLSEPFYAFWLGDVLVEADDAEESTANGEDERAWSR